MIINVIYAFTGKKLMILELKPLDGFIKLVKGVEK